MPQFQSLETLGPMEQEGTTTPAFREALRFWLKLGFISFGGPTAQIAIMHMEVVERRKWIDEPTFLHALNFCMLLPGPEAQQLATYIGWRMHGLRGALAAGGLFVLPSAFILWLLSWIYLSWGTLPWIAALFHGLMPAVMALVADALLRMGRKALRTPVLWAVAACAFVAIRFLHGPFPLIVAGAAAIGFAARRYIPAAGHSEGHVPGCPAGPAESFAADLPRMGRVLGIGLVVWWTPVALVALAGWGTLLDMGIFFSKAALVTFGGAYAVLPYVAQQAVDQFDWLSADQMMVGLGLAETTPGPLIMVLQYVGFVGAWQHPGTLVPLAAATLGAAITTWVTFVPCFIYILLGAPHLERLRRVEPVRCALTAVTAAVVGVMLNLSLVFGVSALFPASTGRIDGFVALLAPVLFVGLWRWKWNVLGVVLGSAALGMCWRFFADAS